MVNAKCSRKDLSPHAGHVYSVVHKSKPLVDHLSDFHSWLYVRNMLSLQSQVFLPFIPITDVRVLLFTCLIVHYLLVTFFP